MDGWMSLRKHEDYSLSSPQPLNMGIRLLYPA